MPEASQFGLTASDGEHIAVVDWPCDNGNGPRGVVLIVHGLGEHSWRYNPLAMSLNQWGFAVRALDLYGHGESGGPRGGLPHERRMLDDLADLVDATWRTHGDDVPLFLLGHSMGGLIAADFVRRNIRPVHGLVMSSPALDGGFSATQKLLLAVLPKLLPNLRVDNGLKVQYLCRDPAIAKAYLADKLVHRHISARLAKYVAQTGPAVLQHAANSWTVPTLLMYAGQDKLVRPEGSEAFVRATAKNPAVKAKCFKAMYHEIFHDPEKASVLAVLQQWLDRQVD
jgi:alpha-beta hydrolase superfamily lysophospholipase